MPKPSESRFDATEDRDPVLNAFMATEEFEDWQDFGDAAEKILTDERVENVEVPTAWLRRVLAEIKSNPLMFQAMADVWNRECDRLGMPERKMMKAPPQVAEEDGNDGPF